MSENSRGSNRLDRLRRIAEVSLSAEGVPEQLADELWELIEQLQAENEELQRSRDEMEQLHRQFAELYELAPAGYLVLNERKTIIRANETARRFLGERAIDYGRTALGPFLYADRQDDYFKALRESREGGEPRTAEICIEREDGYLWLQAWIVADTDGVGTVRGYRITLTDITERIAAQQNAEERRLEVERLLEEKELLLREIHHRVKNDFHLISSFLSLQGANSGKPEVKAAMEEARSRVEVMTRIYRALHRQAKHSRIDLSSLIEEMASGFEEGVAGKMISLETELQYVEVPTATSLSLGLILNEILTNAAKYAFDSVEEPAITVRLRSLAEEELELEVADNGVGLPQEVIDGSARGFGLTIAHALAQQHHCSLILENGGLGAADTGYPGAVARVRMQRG